MKHKFNFISRVFNGGSTVVDTPVSKRSQVSVKCRSTVGRLSTLIFALLLPLSLLVSTNAWGWVLAGEGLPGMNSAGQGWNIFKSMSDQGNGVYGITFSNVEANSSIKYRIKVLPNDNDWTNALDKEDIDNSRSNVEFVAGNETQIAFNTYAQMDICIYTDGSKVWVLQHYPGSGASSSMISLRGDMWCKNGSGWANYGEHTAIVPKLAKTSDNKSAMFTFVMPKAKFRMTCCKGTGSGNDNDQTVDGNSFLDNYKFYGNQSAWNANTKGGKVEFNESGTYPREVTIVYSNQKWYAMYKNGYTIRKQGWYVYLNGTKSASTTDENGEIILEAKEGEQKIFITNGPNYDACVHGADWFGGLYINKDKSDKSGAISFADTQYYGEKFSAAKWPIAGTQDPRGLITINEDCYLKVTFDGGEITINKATPAVTYPVHFNTNGGSSIADVNVAENSPVAKPTNPTKQNKGFAGWYSDEQLQNKYDFSTPVTREMTLYAKWADPFAQDEEIYLYLNGNTSWPSSNAVIAAIFFQVDNPEYCLETQNTTYGDANIENVNLSQPQLGRKYHTLTKINNNWYSIKVPYANAGGIRFVRMSGENQDYMWGWAYSQYVGEQDGRHSIKFTNTQDKKTTTEWYNETPCWTVTFDMMGHGEAIAPKQVIKGEKVAQPTNPSADGWKFINWYKENTLSNVYDFNSAVNSNMTLYAKWEQVEMVTVQFATDGGQPVPENQVIENGGKATKPATDPKKDGYYFTGWDWDFNNTISENKTINAQWHQFTINAALDGTSATVTPVLPEHHGALTFCYKLLDNSGNELAEQPEITVSSTTGAATFTLPQAGTTYQVRCIIHEGNDCTDATVLATLTETLAATPDTWHLYIKDKDTYAFENGATTVALAKEQTYEFKIVKYIGGDNTKAVWYTDQNASESSAHMTETNHENWDFSKINDGVNTCIDAAANGDYVFSITTNNSYPVVSVAYPASYTVTYVGNGATEEDIEIKHFATGEKHTVKPNDTFTREGYHFSGWSGGYTADQEITIAEQDITITAQWETALTALTVSQAQGLYEVTVNGTLQMTLTTTPENPEFDDKPYTWASSNTNYLTVDQNGLVTGHQAGNGVKVYVTSNSGIKSNEYSINVKSAACSEWGLHYWNTQTGTFGDVCFEWVGDNEWRTDQEHLFALPSNSDAEKVKVLYNGMDNTNYAGGKSAEWITRKIPNIGGQKANCGGDGGCYAGQDAIGYFRIYDNSSNENFYLAFQPVYAASFGVEGQPGWTIKRFSNTGNTEYDGEEYETDDVIEVPAGYNSNVKLYVGALKNDGGVNTIGGRSKIDLMKNVNNLNADNMAGKFGKLRIHANWCNESNFDCSFIRYYRLAYSGEGTEGYNPHYVLASGVDAARTVTLGQVPAKTGYNPNGWKIGGTSYAAGASYKLTDDATADAQWTAKTYTITLNRGTKGTADGSATATYDSNTLSITTHVGTPAGYTLEGYYTANEGGSKVCDANGQLIASVDGYTDGEGKWIKDGDATLYAHWTPNPNTPYTVNHYKQNANDDGYTLAETDNLTGTTDSKVTPNRKSYEGFDAPAGEQVTINGDGTTVVDYNYTRKVNNVTYTAQGEGWTYGTTPENAKYGATVNFVVTPDKGYTVTVSSTDADITQSGNNYSFTMPNKAVSVTVSAKFTAQLTLQAAPAIAAPNATVTVTPDLTDFPTNIMICYALYKGTVADANKVDVDFSINKTDHKGQATFTAPAENGNYIVKADVHKGNDCSAGTILSSAQATVTVATYTVTLKDDETELGTVKATYNNPMPAITPPTKFGYIFRGYYTEKNGGGTPYYTGTGASARNYDLTTNLILYAYWTISMYVQGTGASGTDWPQNWLKDHDIDPNHQMTFSNGVYTKTYHNIYGTVYFKLYDGQKVEYDNSYVKTEITTLQYHDCVRKFYKQGNSSTNIVIEVAAESDITISYNLNTEEITVSGVKSHVDVTDASKYGNWYIMGGGAMGDTTLTWNKTFGEGFKCDIITKDDKSVVAYTKHNIGSLSNFKFYDQKKTREFNIIFNNESKCKGGVTTKAGDGNDNFNPNNSGGNEQPYIVTAYFDGYDIWMEATCHVVFDPNNGSAATSMDVIRNTGLSTPANPSRDGYTFVGWYEGATKVTDFTNIKRNMTLQAHWDKSCQTLSDKFNANLRWAETLPTPVTHTLLDKNIQHTAVFDGTGTISYSSSNTSVAQVDNKGVLTIKGEGETTITASITATECFEAGSITYTLKVSRAVNVFKKTINDGWNEIANWSLYKKPDQNIIARIEEPIEINANDAKSYAIELCQGTFNDKELHATMTIPYNGGLKTGTIRVFDGTNYTNTQCSDIYIQANAKNVGYLVLDNSDGKTQAFVESYQLSRQAENGSRYWQYIGVQTDNVRFDWDFIGAYTYLHEETNPAYWTRVKSGAGQFFKTYGITKKAEKTLIYEGHLAPTTTQNIPLTYHTDGTNGINMIGNSWTAPIDITKMDASTFGSAEQTIYIYNTGNDSLNAGYTKGQTFSGGSAGQWLSIPIETAKSPDYKGLKVIPAGQAFEVHTSAATTMTLDYEKLVRGGANSNEPMRAPRRVDATSAINPEELPLMRIRVSGEKMASDIYLAEDEHFSVGFDNGWDGYFAGGDERTAMFYSMAGNDAMAVNALPNIDGTLLGFEPNDEQAYTISFAYSMDKTYYLNDLLEEKSTLIRDDQTYFFLVGGNDLVHRFQISTTPFESYIGTGSDYIGDGVQKVVKFIENDKLFILRNGRLYDGTGKALKPGK